MITGITGTVIAVLKDRVWIRTDSGVDWEVIVNGLARRLTYSEETYLVIWHVINQNTQLLYGFTDIEDRETAVGLARIPKMGPAKASKIVQNVGRMELRKLIESRDAAGLVKRCPGLGPKAAKDVLAHCGTTVSSRLRDVKKALNSVVGDIDDGLLTSVLSDNPDAGPAGLVSEYLKRTREGT